MPIAAVILAGGRGERLGGVNKALLEVGGRRLVDRVRAAIGRCDPILLSVGPEPFAIAGFEAVADLPGDYGGPLAGVAAAIARLGADPPKLLLTVAVDTPFFPADFVSRAGVLIAAAPAVLGGWQGQRYPTNGLWKVPPLRDLPQRVRTGAAPHSLKRLAEELGAATLDYAGLQPEDPFANVNTPADLSALEARARRLAASAAAAESTPSRR
jgi:molybdopterin-guanine dinucleotide biosynthesis protein A